MDRAHFIGGSDVAAIMGLSPWKNNIDVWIEKTGIIPAEAFDEETIQRFSRGHILERYILDAIEGGDMFPEKLKYHSGMKILRNKRYEDKQVPYFSCEIDAQVLDGEKIVANLEIKTDFSREFSKKWGDVDSDQIPVYYMAQVQFGLSITGAEYCLVYVLSPHSEFFKRYIVNRNEEMISQIRSTCSEFWNKYVLTNTVPRMVEYTKDSYDSLARVLITKEQAQEPSEIVITDEDGLTSIAREWLELNKRKQEITEKIESCKARFLERMTDCDALSFPAAGIKVRKQVRAVKEYVVKARNNIVLTIRG